MANKQHDARVPGTSPASTRDRSTSNPKPKARVPQADDSSGDDHVGATEEQVSDIPAPSGEDFQDEPKQG
ncbi:MAG: hypothetical protein HOP16_03885 [Acidobacteria bacterium]|nr:hypothetical protein [Acidobacteriota bacterium]